MGAENKRRKIPTIDGDELCRHAIVTFRRLSQISGPGDRLQTREFRTTCEEVQKIETWIETSIPNQDTSTSTKNQLEALQERYTRQSIFNYLLYYWPLHVYEGLSLLSELPYQLNRVLDIGSGPGSYAMSALLHGAQEVTLFDQSELFLHAAGDLLGRWGFPVKVERGLWPKKQLPQGPYELITIGHAIYEISNGSHKIALELIENALSRLSHTGFLLITTASKEPFNRWFLELRDQVRTRNYEIQAPCIWQGECPAKQHQSSPCYAQRKWEKPYLLKEIQRGAGIFLNSLKMSYMIIRSPTMEKRQLSINPLYRVISPPIEMMGEKRYFLCGTKGKKHIGCRVQHASSDQNTELPKNLRAFQFLDRGSLITFEHALEKNEAVELVTDSSISLVAPCDRPVPENMKKKEE